MLRSDDKAKAAMTINDGMRERMAADAGGAPAGHPPASPTLDRAPRHRRVTVVAVGATVALALIGGFLLRQHATDQAAPRQPAAAAPPDGPSTLPWMSAMVARDGTDITLYTGPGDAQCKELWQPQATIAEQDDARVVIAVNARIVDAADCTTSGTAVPLVVSLRRPLGDRVLRDAATALPHPTYFERDLPDLRSDKRWSPHSGQWMSTDDGWYQGYNGPGGSHLIVSAHRTTGVERPATVATLPIGSRRGAITGRAGRSWTVWWTAGDVTYSLQLMPTEGGTFTLKQFKQEIGGLNWS